MQAFERGQLWETRRGEVVRILETKMPSCDRFPLLAVGLNDGRLMFLTEEGRYTLSTSLEGHRDDLLKPFVPPLEAEGWAIVTDRIGRPMLDSTGAVLLLYADRISAERAMMRTQGERVMRVRVTEVRDDD